MGLEILILGPPGSQKTTTLVGKLKREADPNPHQRVLLINSSRDTRDDGPISTHNDTLNVSGATSNIDFRKVSTLTSLIKEALTYDVVGVDEGHFFPDLVEFVRTIAVEADVRVMVAALAGDVNMELIGQTHRLLPYVEANGIINLGGTCSECRREGVPGKYSIASFVKIDGEDNRVNQIKVGGLDEYIPVCRRHHPRSQKSND